MTDLAVARTHMVDSQVRPNGVTDPRLIEAMLSVPREAFVPAERRSLAYMEGRLSLAPGRYLTEPMIFAKLVHFAEIGPDDKVLLVGAGTGYGAAVLAAMGARVVALEEDAALAAAARANLGTPGIAGGAAVKVVEGALTGGAPAEAPFDRIIIDGAVETLPAALTAQIADGGHLVTVLVEGGLSRGVLATRAGGHIGRRPVFDARLVTLPGFEKPQGFVF